VFGPSGANSDDPELEQMRAAFLQKQQQLAEEKAAEVGANGWALSYKSVNFKYESEDEQGNPITLSAKVYWGVVPFYGALDPDYIVLCPHFTIGSNPECPTSKHTYEAAAITCDNLLIMPDYKGFGETKKMVQPYVNHELCAIFGYGDEEISENRRGEIGCKYNGKTLDKMRSHQLEIRAKWR
jgi:hypothetical protein